MAELVIPQVKGVNVNNWSVWESFEIILNIFDRTFLK